MWAAPWSRRRIFIESRLAGELLQSLSTPCNMGDRLKMLEEVCVSLDIETTGLNAETDDIIEIAAIKFDGGKTIGTFHSLVKPSVPIPYHIQCLTGISPAEVP